MTSKIVKLFSFFRSLPISFWLAIILTASFFIKLVCWHLDPTVSRDGCLYIRLAEIWYNSGSFQGVLDAWDKFWLPPLPLYLMKCLMGLGFSAENAGVWLNLGMGTFTPLLAYGIAWEVTQQKGIAICSAVLIAVNPAMNDYSHDVQRDMIYLFFIGTVLWLLAAGIRRRKWPYWLCSGLVCSCAMMTRFETLEFLVLVPLVLFFMCIGRYCSWKKGICYAGVFFICFFGNILILSSLMHTQDYLLQSYVKYYQVKLNTLQKQYQTEPEILQK